MKELIVVLVFVYALAAIFLLAGYATGRIKHRFAAIICLVAIASAPFLIFLRLPVRIPAWRTYDHLVEVTMWATLFPVLAVAGHVMSRTASSRSVFLARVTVCACLLIFSGYLTLSRGYSTHILNAGFRHQEQVRVGHWEFWLPGRWYGEHDVRWQQLLGARDVLELRRSSWSSVPDQSVVRIITPVSSMVHLHLNDIRMVQDQRFQIEGEYGRCSLTISDQKELRYQEWCQFPDADLAINIEARSEEDLLEAARIVSGARFLKSSDPSSIRQSS